MTPPIAGSSNSILQEYVDFFGKITKDNVQELAKLLTEDIHFRDPFNDLIGRERMLEAFSDMYNHCDDPQFHMLAVVADSERAFLKWRFSFTPKSKVFNGGELVSFIGISEVAFAPDGRIREHLDYWDSAREFHERIPVLGAVLRNLRKRLAIS